MTRLSILFAGLLVLSLLLPAPAESAIARVSGVKTTSSFSAATSGTCIYADDWSTGDLLVIAGSHAHSATPVTVAVADGLANNWNVIAGSAQAPGDGSGWNGYDKSAFIAWFVATAPSGSVGDRTITVTSSAGSTYASYTCDAFSGVAPTSPQDATNSTAGTMVGGDAEVLSTSLTTVTADALIVGIFYNTSTLTDPIATVGTGGAGYTAMGSFSAAGGNMNHFSEFQVVTTVQAYTVDVVTAGATGAYHYQVLAAAFKPPTAAGASATSRRRVQ